MEAEQDPKGGSTTKNHLIVLVRLQALDRERDGNQRLVDQTDGIVEARRAELTRSEEALARAREELKKAKVAAHEAEVDLKSQTEEIQKLELQLNTAKTNQEYQALQTHIGKIKEASSREEEETLVLYERIEQQEEAVGRAEASVNKFAAEFEEFKQVCATDKTTAMSELSETDQRREALMSELPRDMRSDYERVREAREGVAIVPCEDRCCTGCGFTVKPNDVARMMAMNQLVHCDSCQRVLYIPQALQAEPDS